MGNSVIKFDEAKKIWFQIARYTNDDNFSFELELQKKILNVFHPGDHYYFIFNCGIAEVEFASPSVKEILGLQDERDFTINYLLGIIHPQDLSYFYAFENRVTQFFNALPPEKIMKYKVSYDYRVKRRDGTYIRILQQVVTIQSDVNGAVIRVLDVHTDITHLKKNNGSTLSFIGLEGEPSYYDVMSGKSEAALQSEQFTKRELEVLEHLVLGKTSQQIGEDLFISKQTVDGHRKNLLKKTNSKSTVELLMKLA